MSKVLFINGSPNENGCISTAMDEVIRVLNENSIKTKKLWLGKKAMPDCMACMKCQEVGKCVFPDQVNEIGARIDEFSGIVVGSPVYYGDGNFPGMASWQGHSSGDGRNEEVPHRRSGQSS